MYDFLKGIVNKLHKMLYDFKYDKYNNEMQIL